MLQNRNGHMDQEINSERPKTVRMVKRDSKDRIKSPNNCGGEGGEIVPSLLPRGKNGNNNVHEFLNDNENKSEPDGPSNQLTKSSTLPRSYRSEDLKDLKNNGPLYSNLVKPSMIHGYKRKVKYRPFFKSIQSE